MPRTTPVLGAVVFVALMVGGLLEASLAGDAPEKPAAPRRVFPPYAETGVVDTPPPRGAPPRLVVNLLADGTMVFKGSAWRLGGVKPRVQAESLVSLLRELRALTAPDEWWREDGSNKAAVQIFGDRDARWQYAQWIMQVAADPGVMISRIQLGVRSPPVEGEAGNAGGASRPTDRRIEIVLPEEPGVGMPLEERPMTSCFALSLFRQPEPDEAFTKIKVAFGTWTPFLGPYIGGMIEREDDESSSLKVLATFPLPSGQWSSTAKDTGDAARWKHYRTAKKEIVTVVRKILAKRGEKPAPRGLIRTPPPFGQAVPFGDVVLALDALREAGIKDVAFEGSMPPSFVSGQGGVIEVK